MARNDPRRRMVVVAVSVLCAGAAMAAAVGPALTAAVNGAWRSDADKARDQYRHPARH